jgi:hypothetical protein
LEDKLKRAVVATFVAMLMTSACYATVSYLLVKYSPEVIVEPLVLGDVWFSTDNSSVWSKWTLGNQRFYMDNITVGGFYVLLNITQPLNGTITRIEWRLQNKTDGNVWSTVKNANVTTNTSILLNGTIPYRVFASYTGKQKNNYNWSKRLATKSTYRVEVNVYFTPKQ